MCTAESYLSAFARSSSLHFFGRPILASSEAIESVFEDMIHMSPDDVEGLLLAYSLSWKHEIPKVIKAFNQKAEGVRPMATRSARSTLRT